MKSLIVAFGFLCSSSLLSAQVVVPDLNAKTIHFDEHQVSKKDWNSFMKFIKNDRGFSKKYITSVTPDNWSSLRLDEKSKDAAVSGVSWIQAQEYCKWRSELATYLNTHTAATDYQQMLADNKLAKTIITYRLPTGVEFTKLIASNSRSSKDTGGFRCVYSVRNMTLSKSNS